MNSNNILMFYLNQINNNQWNADTEQLFNLLKENKPKACSVCKKEKLGKEFYHYKKKCKTCYKAQYKQNKN